MINAFTVDLEPWMCYYEDRLLHKSLDGGNLVNTTIQLLDILEECDATATFFTLGIVYEWYPQLLNEIRSRGHEIAFHGYSHCALKDNIIKTEIEKSKAFIANHKIIGFRAPRMRITHRDIQSLLSAKFVYDSSFYGSYGISRNMRGIQEVPVSTYPPRNVNATFPRTLEDALKNLEIPIGSGLFMGLLGSKLLISLIGHMNQKGLPFISFIHPWQLSSLPEARLLIGIRNMQFLYTIKISKEKLTRILRRYVFISIREALEEWSMN